jgi:O-acetyl-ADP-ribose deacetylase (regulator of RNase III)
MSTLLKTIATFQVTETTTIAITVGSILDFCPTSSPETAAIINNSNITCIANFISGKNRLEQLVQQAGGERLLAARLELPLIEGELSVRCEVGDAKILGPNRFGKIPTHYVIDAVGPNYVEYNLEQYEDVDELLMSAYGSALERAKENHIKEVATSLIGMDTKGKRSLKQILALGLSALGYWAQENVGSSVTSIVVCTPTEFEAERMVECGRKLGLVPMEESS